MSFRRHCWRWRAACATSAEPRHCRPGSTPSPAASASRSGGAAGSHPPNSNRSTRCSPTTDIQLPDPRPGPEEDLAGRQIEAVLARAIASLDPMYREVLVLRDIEGLTAPEVAEVLGIGVDAVKSRLHRARLAVRKAILPYLGIDDGETGARRPAEVPGRADALLAPSRRRDQRGSLCPDGAPLWTTCGRCRGACESLKHTLALCHSAPTPQVPESVQQSVRDSLRRLLARDAAR